MTFPGDVIKVKRALLGLFSSEDDICREFSCNDDGSDPAGEYAKIAVRVAADALFAQYESGGYDGQAAVIYRVGGPRDGKWYEVHGSHCSCYGLEGQWEPEETTAEAIRMRAQGMNARGFLSWDANNPVDVLVLRLVDQEARGV